MRGPSLRHSDRQSTSDAAWAAVGESRNEPRLSADARRAIATAELVLISVASAWEAAIKVGLGQLRFPESFAAAVLASRLEKLPIAFRHAEIVGTLPNHHSDPFDRMLIAQSLCEGLVLVDARPQDRSIRGCRALGLSASGSLGGG